MQGPAERVRTDGEGCNVTIIYVRSPSFNSPLPPPRKLALEACRAGDIAQKGDDNDRVDSKG